MITILAIKSVALNRARSPLSPVDQVVGLLFGDDGRAGVRRARIRGTVRERHRLLGWMVPVSRALGYRRDQGNMRGKPRTTG